MKKHEVIIYAETVPAVRTNARKLVGAQRELILVTLKLSFWRKIWNFVCRMFTVL